MQGIIIMATSTYQLKQPFICHECTRVICSCSTFNMHSCHIFYLHAVSRHMVVCYSVCGPGRVQTEWVYWQEQQGCNFHAYVALWCLIRIAPNYSGGALHSGEAIFHIWRNLPKHIRDMSKQTFKKFLRFFLLHGAQEGLSFCTLFKICY